MPLPAGTRLGPYEVTALLGAGGMGEVYRARDTRPEMAREVAIKILGGADVDAASRARFEQEARATSALNHPNILAIYDVGTHDGTLYLVEELIDGTTLREVLAKGPLSLRKAIDYARAIAQGLAAAHAKGIIHRDLKPENVMVTSDGRVKILDFGLAKLHTSTPATDASTQTHQTGPGTILGTVAYMAPEQLRAQTIDARADLFSLGVVLYEMLSGARPFSGDTAVDTQVAILSADPREFAADAGIPQSLARIVRRCLEKAPAARFQSASDLGFALDTLSSSNSDIPPAASPRPQRRVGLVSAVAAGAAVIAGLLGLFLGRNRSVEAIPQQPVVKFALSTPPAGPVHLTGDEPDVAISPDGTSVVYLSSSDGAPSGRQLYIRRLGQLEATPLAGTAGAREPFFSADGQWVGFENSRDVSLRKVPISGGPAVLITKIDNPIQGAAWGSDGVIVFATRSGKGLLRVSAAGGDAVLVTKTAQESGEVGHFWPSLLPDGKSVLFTRWRGSEEVSEIAVASLSSGQITPLIRGGSSPHYVRPGHIMFGMGGTIRAVGFDATTLTLSSAPPVAVADGVSTKFRYGAVNFDVSRDGALAYVVAGDSGMRSVVAVDRNGRETDLGLPIRAYSLVRVAPDGQRLALVVREPAMGLWIWDLARKQLAPIAPAFPPSGEGNMEWTPDSRGLAFSTGSDIVIQPADGAGQSKPLVHQPGASGPVFVPGGGSIVFTVGESNPNSPPYDIWRANLSDSSEPHKLLASRFSENGAALSPDGRWIAYQSDESGRNNIYVRPFPNVEQQRIVVSTEGGEKPVWSRDGRELLYYVSPGSIMAVDVNTGPTLSFSAPRALFRGNYPTLYGPRHFDISADGRQFIMLKPAESTAPRIAVVLGWQGLLSTATPDTSSGQPTR